MLVFVSCLARPSHMLKPILLFLFFVAVSFKPQDDYATYCNSRFAFCIKYPKGFGKGKESQNADGATFTSKDGKAEIRAYGSLAIEGFDKLDQQFKSATEGVTLTYKTVKADWFVFSGTDGSGNFIYQKIVKKKIEYYGNKGTAVFQTVRIKYPAGQQKNYQEYCKVMAKSF